MKLNKRILVFAAVSLAAVMLSGCTLIGRLKARDHLNKGVSAYELKKYDEATEHFQKSIELDPALIPAYLYLATTYRAQFIPGATSQENIGRARKAIATFEEALKQDPTNANAMANIAGIYQGLNEYDQAKEWYHKRAETESTNPEPLYGIGVINWQLSYDKTGMTGEAVDALSAEEKAEVNQLLDEGIDAMKQALEIKPDYTQAMEYLNLLYREKAKLTKDKAEKDNWLLQADKLALTALEQKKKQQEEAERARRTLTGTAQK